jgi:hypothetical protein
MQHPGNYCGMGEIMPRAEFYLKALKNVWLRLPLVGRRPEEEEAYLHHIG